MAPAKSTKALDRPIDPEYAGIRLSAFRFTIKPVEFFCDWRVRSLTHHSTGILLTIAGWAATTGFPLDPLARARAIAGICGVRPMQAVSAWRSLSGCFEERAGRVFLSDNDWLSVAVINPDLRPNLSSLRVELESWWGAQCVYCGASGVRLDIEHITPRVRGGADSVDNLTLACSLCNSRKGRKTAAEFGFPHVHQMAKGVQ